MRLLYITTGYTVHDRRFLTAFAGWGWRLTVLQLDSSHVLEERTLPDGTEVLRWPSATVDPAAPESFVEPLKSVLGAHQPDVVYAGPIPTAGWVAAQAGAQPLVLMSWGSDVLLDAESDEATRDRVAEALSLARLVQSDCDAVSRRVHETYGYHGPIVQFPWGVDLERFAPGPRELGLRERPGWRDALIVLSVRTWAALYGIETVLESFRLARRREARLRLVLTGSGPLEARVRDFVISNGLQEDVYMPGRVSNEAMPPYFREADLYVSCSHSDGSSISLLEAMACGLPAVVSDIEGNAEWIDAAGGRLSPIGDAACFAQALTELARDRKARESAGKRNRAVAVDRANWNRNVPALRDAILSL